MTTSICCTIVKRHFDLWEGGHFQTSLLENVQTLRQCKNNEAEKVKLIGSPFPSFQFKYQEETQMVEKPFVKQEGQGLVNGDHREK